jgi:hypothetical protein
VSRSRRSFWYSSAWQWLMDWWVVLATYVVVIAGAFAWAWFFPAGI